MKRLIPLLIAIAAIVSSAYAQGYDRILNIYKDGVLKHKYNVTGLDYIDFEKKPKLKVTAVVSPENSGTVTINGLSSPQYISEDSTVTFIASPKDGYVFSNWVINGKEIPVENTTYTTTITRDTECVANFVSVASSDLGVSLQGNAFAIPTNEIGFSKESSFTISFRVYINQFNHDTYGTQLLNIRSALDPWPQSDWGYMWSQINTDGTFSCAVRSYSDPDVVYFPMQKDYILQPKTWYRLTFCKEYDSFDGSTFFYLYLNGELISEINLVPYPWLTSNVIMIGGTAFGRAGLDGTIDDVRLYDEALTEEEISHLDQFSSPNLIGYWNFESIPGGDSTLYTIYSDVYNKNIPAKMYNIDVIDMGNQNFISVPFYFTEGY